MKEDLQKSNGPLEKAKAVAGYPALALKMGGSPEHTILRRFDSLGIQNLLYYQAELVHLEDRLREVEALAEAQGDGAISYQYARDWDDLKGSGSVNKIKRNKDGENRTAVKLCCCQDPRSSNYGYSEDVPKGAENEQLLLVLQLRRTLKEYQAAVFKQVFMSNLVDPGAQDLRHIRAWLADSRGGNFPLDGKDSDIWESADDLFALRQRPDTDQLSTWVLQNLMPRYHKYFGHYLKKPKPEADNSVTYNDNYVPSALVTILSSILIIVPVIVLRAVKPIYLRLGLLTIFTIAFSLCMSLLTNAKRSEVFAATAAFAAVQVVFIGTSDPTTIIIRDGVVEPIGS